MRRKYIKVGDEINTETGILEIVQRNAGDLAICNEYEIQEDGDLHRVGTRMLTTAEIARIMKDRDGLNHRVYWENEKAYTVYLTDPETGATSPIDTIEERAGYTAADYISDCEGNADPEWVEMLHRGEVELIEVQA